jgi:glucosamine-6-phosphate deaminase
VGSAGIPAHCRNYEEEISAAGGIDYQILGIGRNGHIGFNEPGTASDSRTSRVTLHETTRHDAAEEFGGLAAVPTEALTMGCGTILGAGRIALMAWGAKKAGIVRKSILGPVTPDIPASCLQSHPASLAFLDPAAASALTQSPP